MRAKIFLLICLASVATLRGQTPVGTAAPAPAPTALAAAPAAASNVSMQPDIALLQEMKKANEEMIKKQQAVLETLDDLQKAADQIKIYSKRS